MSDSLRPHRLYSPWNSPGQNTGVGSLSLLQGIFPTQGSNPGLPRCRRILYQLSHKVQREVLLSSRRRPSLTAKTNIFYFFPGLPGTDLESQQCHAFWRALHRKQMFKFSLGSCSFVVDNSLAHLSAWGTATQLMVGGDWVPTKQRRRTTACWAGHVRRPPLVSSGSRQRLSGGAGLSHWRVIGGQSCWRRALGASPGLSAWWMGAGWQAHCTAVTWDCARPGSDAGAHRKQEIGWAKRFQYFRTGMRSSLPNWLETVEDKLYFLPSASWPRKPSSFQQPLLAVLWLLNTHLCPNAPWGQPFHCQELCGEGSDVRGLGGSCQRGLCYIRFCFFAFFFFFHFLKLIDFLCWTYTANRLWTPYMNFLAVSIK